MTSQGSPNKKGEPRTFVRAPLCKQNAAKVEELVRSGVHNFVVCHGLSGISRSPRVRITSCTYAVYSEPMLTGVRCFPLAAQSRQEEGAPGAPTSR